MVGSNGFSRSDCRPGLAYKAHGSLNSDHVQPGITGTPATKRAQPLVSRPAGDQGEDQENQTEECKCTTGNHQKDLPNYDADYQ